MNDVRRLNNILATLFSNVLKVEESVMKKSKAKDLSVTEIHTLVAIGKGEAKTMTQVADALKVNVSTLTAAINKLVAKDYVNRFRIQEDRRIVMVELTEAGARAVREHEAYHFVMLRDVLAQLAPAEKERFLESLEGANEFLLRRIIKNKSKEASI